MDGLARCLGALRTWPAFAGLSLALGAGLAAFGAGAHIPAPTAAPGLPLPGLTWSIDRLVDAAQAPGAVAPELRASILPTPPLQKGAPASVADPAAAALIQQGYGRLPMYFEPNQGQTAAEVRYLARGAGYSLFLTDSEAVLVLRKAVEPASSRPEAGSPSPEPAPTPRRFGKAGMLAGKLMAEAVRLR